MGGCLSISLSSDDLIRTFSFLCGQGYIQNVKQNLKDLEKEMEDLKAAQDAVKNKIAVEERQPRQQMTEGVKLWLTRIEKTETEYNTLREVKNEELQKLCLCDFGSKNVYESYKYGKRVFLLLEDVKKLNSVGKFEVVTEQTLTSEIVERPTGPTIGQELILEKAWKRLMDKDKIGIMGLHGMGGVGKTTLFKKIHNKFTEYKDTVQEWEHAVDVLTKSAAKYPGIENILSILKYSYDSLGDEHIKLCFLYCALFPEDGMIYKEVLIKYWICEGFLGESPDIKKAINKGYEIIGALIRGNLLMAKVGTICVVMHDVVREMALWIASDFFVTRGGTTISKLQDDIAKKLYICDEGWDNKNESDKAAEIYRVLTRKKFVLMLDDIWKEVGLDAIGVPFPTRENGCKVAFTTRSREVCVRMGDHEPMQVKCLEEEEAWELFEKMVGANTLRNDPVIEQLARKVAEKCGWKK